MDEKMKQRWACGLQRNRIEVKRGRGDDRKALSHIGLKFEITRKDPIQDQKLLICPHNLKVSEKIQMVGNKQTY